MAGAVLGPVDGRGGGGDNFTGTIFSSILVSCVSGHCIIACCPKITSPMRSFLLRRKKRRITRCAASIRSRGISVSSIDFDISNTIMMSTDSSVCVIVRNVSGRESATASDAIATMRNADGRSDTGISRREAVDEPEAEWVPDYDPTDEAEWELDEVEWEPDCDPADEADAKS